MKTPSSHRAPAKRRPFHTVAAIVLFGAIASSAWSQTKWDLASAYPASNFHTENLAQFAGDVEKATGGQLKITVHSGASLYKALDKAQQEAVLKAAAAAEDRGWKASQEKNEAAKKTLLAKGMKVQQPSSKLVSDMKQPGWTMPQEWQKKAGPDGESIIQAYLKMPSFAGAAAKPAATAK